MTETDDIQVTIILPAYNEELAIGKDLTVINETMSKAEWRYEILVVDDGSTDGTAEVSRQHGARVVRHSRNRGVGRARKTGLRHARGEIIVMTDADGTYPNHLMPELIRGLDRADMVVGAREREAGTLPLLRTFAKETIRRIAQLIAGEPIPDLNSGLRAFRRSTTLRFLNILPDTHSWVTTQTLSYLCNEYIVHYFPVPYYPRIGKSTFHPIKDTYFYMMLVIRTLIFFRPLKVLMPLAITLCLWGLAKFIWDWQIYRDVRESDIMIILVGLIIGVLGLLAELVVAGQRTQYLTGKKGHEEVLE